VAREKLVDLAESFVVTGNGNEQKPVLFVPELDTGNSLMKSIMPILLLISVMAMALTSFLAASATSFSTGMVP
jgi:hypothetical protein